MQLQGEPYMRKHFTNFILMFILFVGLSLLLYPTASDYWNSHHQTRAITTYADNVAALDHARYEELLEAARIDGANGRQLLRYIKIPMIRSSITICAVLYARTNGLATI